MTVRHRRAGEVLGLRREPVSVDPAGSYAAVGVRSFANGLIRYPPCSGADLSKMRYYRLPLDALVVSNIKAWEGAVALSSDDDNSRVVSNRFLTYLTRSEDVSLRYLWHYFACESGTRQLAQASPGSADRNRTLGIKAFEDLVIPLPGIDEQRTIAARLDAVASGEATITGACTPRPEPLRWLSTLLDECFRRAALPQVRADSLFTTVSDIVQPTEDPAPATRFVGLEHLERDSGIRISSGPISPRSGRKFRFLTGDVLYGYLRPYLNKVWAADGPGLCSVEQYVLRPLQGVMPSLLSQALRCGSTLQAVNNATHRLQLPRIRTALLGAIEVPDVRMAPPDLRRRLDAVDGAAIRLHQFYARQTELRASLLTAARNEVFSKLV